MVFFRLQTQAPSPTQISPADDPTAFFFLNPDEVIRCCHIIPASASGTTTEFFPEDSVGRLVRDGLESNEDWRHYYVNFFVDRDMFMRYLGGSVGHYQIKIPAEELAAAGPSGEQENNDDNDSDDDSEFPASIPIPDAPPAEEPEDPRGDPDLDVTSDPEEEESGEDDEEEEAPGGEDEEEPDLGPEDGHGDVPDEKQAEGLAEQLAILTKKSNLEEEVDSLDWPMIDYNQVTTEVCIDIRYLLGQPPQNSPPRPHSARGRGHIHHETPQLVRTGREIDFVLAQRGLDLSHRHHSIKKRELDAQTLEDNLRAELELVFRSLQAARRTSTEHFSARDPHRTVYGYGRIKYGRKIARFQAIRPRHPSFPLIVEFNPGRNRPVKPRTAAEALRYGSLHFTFPDTKWDVIRSLNEVKLLLAKVEKMLREQTDPEATDDDTDGEGDADKTRVA
ncbi:hypothetical protein C8R46DRAFT_1361941 [Mycena filopes]|nr:hypothetical protein C8R46DRAFT_1361941 [Mycena filopes]